MWSGALDSSPVLLSYSTTSLQFNINNIVIKPQLFIHFIYFTQDWGVFSSHVKKSLRDKASHTWDPIHKRLVPWVDMGELDNTYGGAGSSACSIS